MGAQLPLVVFALRREVIGLEVGLGRKWGVLTESNTQGLKSRRFWGLHVTPEIIAKHWPLFLHSKFFR